MKHSGTRIWPVQLVVLLIASCVVSACGSLFPSPPVSTALPLQPGELALVTHEPFSPPQGMPLVCAGVGLNAMVHGDPTDPKVAWLINRNGGSEKARIEVAWPPGFRARFVPRLEVLDDTGRVRLREGDHINGTCGSAADGAVILELSFPWATGDNAQH
jgi:hypothetical protein